MNTNLRRRLPVHLLGAAVFILGAMLSSGGCAVPDKKVIAQAQDVHASLEPAVMTDPVLAKYFQDIGDRIVEVGRRMDRQRFGPKSHKEGEDTDWMYEGMKFHLVNSKTLNAFTTGGKHMYLYNELFQSCKNEDELAAVMSHEYAHVYCRHVKKGMQRQQIIIGTAAAAGVAGAVAGYQADDTEGALKYGGTAFGAAMALGSFVGMSFTRDDEDEADDVGFQFYCRAGWDPKRFSGFFQTLIDKGYDKTPEALSDHPKLANRVAATRQRVEKLPREAASWRRPPVADEKRFRELQARAAKLGKSMPHDQSLEKAQLMLASFPSCVTPEDQPDQKRAQSLIRKALEQRKKQ